MILTRHDIRDVMNEGSLAFDPPLDKFQNQPHAVDLRLGTIFYVPKIWKLSEQGREILKVDVTETAGDNYEKIELKGGQYFELAPNESIIASTLESVTMTASDIMGILYPRSSINRRGLSVDLTGIIDVHYSGNLMIPILNKTATQVIRVYPYERICQLVLYRLAQGVTQEEAMIHGKIAAKYNDSDGSNLMSKKDDETELQYIKKGHLEKLKEKSY